MTARNHIRQFKEISQAGGEALASLHATHDKYKSTTEAQLTASSVYFASFCVYFHEYSLVFCRPNKKPSRAL